MALIEDLLPLLKRQVNAVDFDSDDALLQTNLRRAYAQMMSMCKTTRTDLDAISASMTEDELECGIPADFAGALLELASAMYRYGEAYSEATYRFTPSFEMVVSRYRKHYNPFKPDDDESA